jgi:hypothetical protein
VIDIGAGPGGVRRWLDPTSSCVGLDLVDRGPSSIVCDLNRDPLPDLSAYRFSVATLGGVLEYVRDVPKVVAWLAQYVGTCIASYECAPERSRLRALDVVRRARAGWVSCLTEQQIRRIFGDHGFVCTGVVDFDGGDGPGRVFVFTAAA